MYSEGVVAGVTDAAKDGRDVVSRTDSGMSGIRISSPEATTPIARDFALSQQKIGHEKHDIPRMMMTTTSICKPRPTTRAGSVKMVSFSHPDKENLGRGRRFKEAFLTTFGGHKQQPV